MMEKLTAFVQEHIADDLTRLVLDRKKWPDIDIDLAVSCIQSRRKLKGKVQEWHSNPSLIFPAGLSAEQCSSTATALYKARLADRIARSGKDKAWLLADLTGGLGVDSWMFSKAASAVIYNEMQQTLCEAARHNFKILGADNIEISNNVAGVDTIDGILGENIELTVYITDTVELAGFAMDIYVLGDTLSYNDANAADADLTMNLMCDYTGGKHIGDYTDISMTLKDEYDTVNIAYVQKYETNGDFDVDFTFESDDDSIAITADGNYVVDGDFFSFVIDSIKFIENDTVIGDFGLSFSFKPIDAVTKPSGEPVYDIWEMDEDDFGELIMEIGEKLEEFVEMFE